MKRAYDLLDRLGSMPARKKGKGNPQPPTANGDSSLTPESATKNGDSPPIDQQLPNGATRPSSLADSAKSRSTSTQDADDGTSVASNRASSWYGSSWKSKAPAMTGLDKDSNVTPEATPQRANTSSFRLKQSPSSPSKYMANNARRPSKSVPVAATTSLVNVSSTGSADTKIPEDAEKPTKKEDAPLPPEPVLLRNNNENAGAGVIEPAKGGDSHAQPAALTSTWRGWWSKPDIPVKESIEKTQTNLLDGAKEEAKQTPLPESPEAVKKADPLADLQVNDSAASSVKGKADGSSILNQNRSSWFWAWSKAQNANSGQSATEDKADSKSASSQPDADQQLQQPEAAPAQADDVMNGSKDPGKPAPSSSSSSWAFWSREKTSKEDALDTSATRKEVGELAVANTPSQTHPEAAQFNEQREPPKKETPSLAKKARGRIKGNESSSNASTPAKGTPSGSPSRNSTDTASLKPATQPPTSAKKKGPSSAQAQAEGQPTLNTKNALLPKFDGTYHPSDSPSYWEQIRRFFVRAGAEPPRVHLESNPPRVQRALAVGVHGFFPAAILRQVLGQPTGTSIKFSNYAASAIKEWVRQHGDYECEIEKVALEGEGFIADRVDTLWKLLLNWIDKIRKADLIIVAAHSQGVPVATMLVAKLIQFGCVNANARIGICAMAGVNMGPFVEYRTSWLGGTANELFEFSRPDSKVSIMYEEALEECLRHGVRICYVGSIDDQLVSLESSTFTPVTHPYIYRAVFVHSSLLSSTTALNPMKPQPDFIASLVGFALKLRNLGVPDHGLIRELSPALAGSLVGGDGHSSLYNDLNVYLLALRCTLETKPLSAARNPPVERWGLSGNTTTSKPAEKEKGRGDESAAMSANATAASTNPFFLPWALRGVLEEELVRKELGDECRDLLALFESWRPVSKGLKDVRFRLEAVRSKL